MFFLSCLTVSSSQGVQATDLLQMVNRVGAGFCPAPQPAGLCHISRHSVTDDLDRILMQDQPSKFYYVITGAHGILLQQLHAAKSASAKLTPP